MFSNSYQSGTNIELFSTQNKELVKNWKFTGKVGKDYDSNLKGYVHFLNCGGTSKMQIPGNEKMSLGIVQSFIVFQVYLFSPKLFSIEIAISDTSKTKRRLMFSTSTRDITINHLHCRVPISAIPIGIWVNFSIDVLSFVSECFKSQTFRSIDYISFSANCKIRKVFSMRNSLLECNSFNLNKEEVASAEYAEMLPKNLAIPGNIYCENINLNIEKVKGIVNNNNPLKESVKVNKMLNPVINNKVAVPNLNQAKLIEKINILRAKSQIKPVKNNNGELFTSQEFIEDFKPNRLVKIHSNSTEARNLHKEKNATKKKGRKVDIVAKSPSPLLNNVNYKSIEKWENSKESNSDSIEEIYNIDDHKTNEKKPPSVGNVEKSFSQNSAQKYYYDIPIKDAKKTDAPTLSTVVNIKAAEEDGDSKKKIIQEILETNTKELIEKNRPFSPPFTQLVPMSTHKSIEKGSVIYERVKEENASSLKSSMSQRDEYKNKNSGGEDICGNVIESLEEKIQENKCGDLVYDNILGCYFDPKTNIYYELRNTAN